MKKKQQPCVVFDSGTIYSPKFTIGDYVKRRGEKIEGEVLGWTFYVGVKMYGYWIKGYGNDIPEDELIKKRK